MDEPVSGRALFCPGLEESILTAERLETSKRPKDAESKEELLSSGTPGF